MSIYHQHNQQHQQNYRLINVDRLDPDSPCNFDLFTLLVGDTALPPPSSSDAQNRATQIRQLLRGGDAEGAMRAALEPRAVPYGAEERVKDLHLGTVVEVLQSIKQADMSPLLTRIYHSEGGSELLDVLMKYLYKGMAHAPAAAAAAAPSDHHQQQQQHGRKSLTPQPTGFSQIHSRGGPVEGGGAAMSLFLSWHEKLVDIAGPGSIVRVMTDRRTV